MNPEIKKLWVEALRSGDYKQGRSQLRYGDKFCCLGVLCNLHALAHPAVAARETDPQYYLGAATELPIEVVRWAGLEHIDPEVVVDDEELPLSVVNDGAFMEVEATGRQIKTTKQYTFNEIAQLIEDSL